MNAKFGRYALILSIAVLCAATGLYGRFAKLPAPDDTTDMQNMADITDIQPEPVPLAESPPMFFLPEAEASGKAVSKNAKAEIDYSNTSDGYIMAKFLETTGKVLKVQIEGPSGTVYTYGLNRNGKYEVFPLSDSNGKYRITVYENVTGTKYAAVVAATANVTLTDEFAPFLRPNQYVNYDKNTEAVKKAAELTKNISGVTEKVAAVYQYVTSNITYDKELAASVQSGYLPNIDAVLKKGKGICFDYAAVTTAMLRSQMIPTKLVVGYYTGGIYHAWISVYSEETGWVDGVIYFDGTQWKLMDPTWAAGGTSKNEVIKIIGDGKNYTARYLY